MSKRIDIFVPKRVEKKLHREVVTLPGQSPVFCQNGCGLFYIPTDAIVDGVIVNPDAVCPDCHALPRLSNVGEPEEIDVAVTIGRSDATKAEFLSSHGPVVNTIQRKTISTIAQVLARDHDLATTKPRKA